MTENKVLVPSLFPEIYDIKDFIQARNYPVIHPDSFQYSEYWSKEEKKCLEGFWGKDFRDGKGGYRYASGPLYFYVNYAIIADEDEKGKTTANIIPKLRDVEWIVFYGWLVANGFSGFMDDDEYTCNLVIKKIEDGIELSPKEKIEFDKLKHLKKEDGSYKTYIDPIEYLYQTFEKPLGLPIYDNPAKDFMWLASRSLGKALSPDELVLSQNGWKSIKDLTIGELIYGSDGKLTKVLAKTDITNDLNFYKITLSDGRTIEACEDHNWKVWNKNLNRNNKIDKTPVYSTLTTGEILKIYKQKSWKSRSNRYIEERICHLPLNKCIDYDEKDLAIEPYLLGLWLGDGSSNSVAITTNDDEIKDYIYNVASRYKNHKVNVTQNKYKNCPTYRITEGLVPNVSRELRNKFKNLNVFNNKHIPEIYLTSSREQRLELLKGLMDTDGTSSNGSLEYYSKSKRLAYDVYHLSLSLGFYTTIKIKQAILNGKNYGDSYRVKITTDEKMFKLKRKLDNQKTVKNNRPFNGRYSRVSIKEIEYIGKKPGMCITVDNNDSTYITKDYIVTHNSVITAGILAHVFTFFGKKYYDDEYIYSPAGIEIAVGSAQVTKSTELLKKMSSILENLKTGPGSYGKHESFIPGYFYLSTSGSMSPSNKSPFRHEYQIKEGGTWVTKGTGTKLVHVAWGDNAEAAVGGRYQVIACEEVGLADDILQIQGANRATMIRRNKFGSCMYIGTAGNMEKITGSKIMFENPDSYDLVEYKDIWENRMKPIGLFIPAYYRDNTFKDPNGNTNIQLAYEQELINRKGFESAQNSSALDNYIMSNPLVPSEMFISGMSNVFPTAKLRELEAWMDTKNIFKTYASIGDLSWAGPERKAVRWTEDLSTKRLQRPIVDLNLDKYKGNLHSSIVIYEHPSENIPNPTYYRSLYKVVYDPVADDHGGTSLASILVYKGFAEESWNGGMQDAIVAEYVGRYDIVDDIHEIAVKIATYYNAMILYENNLPGFKNYCAMNGHIHRLMISPYEAISKSGIKTFSKKYEFGVHISEGLKTHCEQLIRKLLLEKYRTTEDGRKEENLWKIKSPRLLKELISYNRNGNFDHVSAMMILVLWLSQEKEKVIEEQTSKVDPNNDLEKYFKQTIKKPRNGIWFS